METFKEYKDWINQWKDNALEPIEGRTWVELVTLLRLKVDVIEGHVDTGMDNITKILDK